MSIKEMFELGIYVVIEQKGECAVILRRNCKQIPFVVAYGLNDDLSGWAYGHYFIRLEDAVKEYSNY